MDAVSDVADGNLFFGHAGPQRPPHPARDLPVQPAYAITRLSQSQREHGHAERLSVVVRILSSQRQKIAERQAETVGVLGEVTFHQIRLEVIVARGYGSVRGEDQSRGSGLARFGERELARLHQPPDAFEREEGRMAFIQMVNARLNPQRLQGATTADA